MPERGNFSARELGHFDALASRWWDPEGEFRTLHDLNPVRVRLLDDLVGLAGKRCLDVGCGGGLLAEAMARRGADVLAIDLSEVALTVARLHLHETGLHSVAYRLVAVETLAGESPGAFDAVTCMELLEHVPDPALLVMACAQLVKPGGSVVFSTINRGLKAFLLAILAAEYATGLVPRGTHRYDQLIRPSELDAWGRAAGLTLENLVGVDYHPVTRQFTLGGRPDVNYVAHFRAGGTP